MRGRNVLLGLALIISLEELSGKAAKASGANTTPRPKPKDSAIT